jgi:hypothetical protein
MTARRESGRAPFSPSDKALVRCANLVYAGNKTSKCFSDNFLTTLELETNITPLKSFESVKLAGEKVFEYPFAVMTGEGVFSLHEAERTNLRSYLERGGFLLASAGCSSRDWGRSFRREMKKVFPEHDLQDVSMDHPLFETVFDIRHCKLRKSSGSATLQGLELDGRIVVIYSPEGLNDTANAGRGCCCCGGNEIANSREINVNIITYALTH